MQMPSKQYMVSYKKLVLIVSVIASPIVAMERVNYENFQETIIKEKQIILRDELKDAINPETLNKYCTSLESKPSLSVLDALKSREKNIPEQKITTIANRFKKMKIALNLFDAWKAYPSLAGVIKKVALEANNETEFRTKLSPLMGQSTSNTNPIFSNIIKNYQELVLDEQNKEQAWTKQKNEKSLLNLLIQQEHPGDLINDPLFQAFGREYMPSCSVFFTEDELLEILVNACNQKQHTK